MESTLYASMVLLCIAIDWLLQYHMLRAINQSTRQRKLELTFGGCIGVMTADLLWTLRTSGVLNFGLWVGMVINTAYFALQALSAWFWFDYEETVSGSEFISDPKKRRLCMIPLAAVGVMLIVNIPTGCIFRLDGPAVYSRGPLFLPCMSLQILYLVAGSLLALKRSFRSENRMVRDERRTLASFIVLPALGGIIQCFWTVVPAEFAGMTLSMLIVYIYIETQEVSVDALTHINNRSSFYRYMNNRLQGECGDLWMLFMDGDRFKQINDQFGHNAGDDALVHMADALKRSVPSDGFVARFGGDEFLMIVNAKTEADVLKIRDRIRSELDDIVRKADLKYPLSMSIGITHWNEGMHTVESLIAAADEALYIDKRSRHSVRTE